MKISNLISKSFHLIPRLHSESISIVETGDTGFGDRLRGISFALFLANWHKVNKIYYSSETEKSDRENAAKAFPFNMCELISLENKSLIEGEAPANESTIRTKINSSTEGTQLAKLGFKYFETVRPRNPEITNALERLGINSDCIGFHVRGTDAVNTFRFYSGIENIEKRAIDNLEKVSSEFGIKRIFLAADNRDSQNTWHRRMEELGYEVIINNNIEWNPNALRQTGAEEMLIDFFGLSRCRKVVRLVPSEFSRFPAWIAGQRLSYLELV